MRRLSLHVTGHGELSAVVSEALTRCGLHTTPRPRRADVLVLVSNGSPGPPLSPQARDDLPQMAVVVGDDGSRVGPFSWPGENACPGCVAAHEEERERLAPLMAVAAPDPARAVLAAALAGADLLRLGRDGIPMGAHGHPTAPPGLLTWSAVVEIPGTGLPRQVRVPKHPHCGCTWGDFLLPWSG